MPPSTFASAAAGSNRETNARQDPAATPGNEWSNRRTNGATQTFRRPSSNQVSSATSNAHAPLNASPIAFPATRDVNGSSASNNMRNVSEPGPGVYVPPHRMTNGSGAHSGPDAFRYSKQEMYDFFRSQRDSSDLENNLAECYVSGWDPVAASGSNGVMAQTPWSRRDEAKDPQYSLETAWDSTGSSLPLGLVDLTDEERQRYVSVNSTVKPPVQNTANKDGSINRGDRKVSGTQAQTPSSAYTVSSPTSARPGNRRRDTSDGGYPFPSVNTREKPNAQEVTSPFGGLKRSVTGGSGPTWAGSSSSGGFAPMGSFGVGNRPGLTTGKSESRFKGLMSRDGDDSLRNDRLRSGFGRLGAHAEEAPSNVSGRPAPTAPLEESEDEDDDDDDDDEDDEDANEMLGAAGSAALAGSLDDTPPRPVQRDTYGTSDVNSFGTMRNNAAPSDGLNRGLPGFSGYQQSADTSGWAQTQTPNHPHHKPGEPSLGESMSPTDTNPYQSPSNGQNEASDIDISQRTNSRLPGLMTSGFQNENPLPGLGGMTSATSLRGFPSLGGLSGLGGLPGLGASASPWSTSNLGGMSGLIGTPTREKSAFGSAFGESNFMSAPSDGISPALAGLGSSSMLNNLSNPGFGSIGRPGLTSRGSLLPKEMRDEMRGGSGFAGDMSMEGSTDLGRLGRDSPFQAGYQNRARPQTSRDDAGSVTSSLAQQQTGYRASPTQGGSPTSGHDIGVAGSNRATSASDAIQNNFLQQQRAHAALMDANNPPLPQARRMVMPDRIRWVYNDPQGHLQGPFSGLEMNDWYKAGFFTPELLIRKIEDEEYEPLAQLIRRIGNSREPFLVPLLGIPPPEDSPSEPPAATWPAAAPPGSITQPQPGGGRGVVPPFAGSFPSFGTTLTAEQQNALERRKQEEQWLMAQQKDHLNQYQLLAKLHAGQGPRGGHGFGGPGGMPYYPGLQHQGSAQSLQSQPSYGSLNGPFPSGPHGNVHPPIGPLPTSSGSSFEGSMNRHMQQGQPPIGAGFDSNNLPNIREDDMPGMMGHLSMGRDAQQSSRQPSTRSDQAPGQGSANAVSQMLQDRERLQREQQEHDMLQQQLGAHGMDAASEQRARQFQELRSQDGPSSQGVISRPAPARAETLTEQVQKAQSAKQQKVDTAIATNIQQIISPPVEMRGSPIPAPIAQRRTAQTVAESLAAESRSDTQSPAVSSPAVETPSASLAPWAAQNAESSRGPSLKEIQEAEARKAKIREAAEQEKRRIALEREMLLLAQQAATSSKEPAPGLPSSSNWAAAPSPLESKPSPSVWSAATVAKPVAAPAGLAPKKTLQQIQKEEESRKIRALAAQQQAASLAAGIPSQVLASGGKRYAELASKPTVSLPGSVTASAWTTVGASGKGAKPTVPSNVPGAAPATLARAVSGTVPTAPTPVASKPKPLQRTLTASTTAPRSSAGGDAKTPARAEFENWATHELKTHASRGYDVAGIMSTIIDASDMEMIVEVVHSCSQTIDSRHFAEEFIHRRKQADKGIVVPSSHSFNGAKTGALSANGNWTTVPLSTPGAAAAGSSTTGTSASGTGGWNDIAKKGPAVAKEETPANFRVVPGKKKGGRK